jgi:hypothetical protein
MILGSFNNISLEAAQEGQHFVSLWCRHGEFLQRSGGMLHKDRPVATADTQTFVGGLHIATCVEDRASGSLSHIVDDQ